MNEFQKNEQKKFEKTITEQNKNIKQLFDLFFPQYSQQPLERNNDNSTKNLE